MRAGFADLVNVPSELSAIFKADHAASPLVKIALIFCDSTSSAAASARALSLRRNSGRARVGDAAFVVARLLRAGPGLLGRGGRLCDVVEPLLQVRTVSPPMACCTIRAC